MHTYINLPRTKYCHNSAIPIIIEGRFQAFSNGVPVVNKPLNNKQTVESCSVALKYYGNGSTLHKYLKQ